MSAGPGTTSSFATREGVRDSPAPYETSHASQYPRLVPDTGSISPLQSPNIPTEESRSFITNKPRSRISPTLTSFRSSGADFEESLEDEGRHIVHHESTSPFLVSGSPCAVPNMGKCDDWIRGLCVYYPSSNNQYNPFKIEARAQVDTGCHRDAISLSLVERHFPQWKPAAPALPEEIRLLNNTTFEVLGEITLYWYGNNDGRQSPTFRFTARTCQSTFSVSKEHDFPCDIILGQPAISTWNLLKDCYFGSRKKGEIAIRRCYKETRPAQEVQGDKKANLAAKTEIVRHQAALRNTGGTGQGHQGHQ